MTMTITTLALDDYQLLRTDEFNRDCVAVCNYIQQRLVDDDSPYVVFGDIVRNVPLISGTTINKVLQQLRHDGVVKEFEVEFDRRHFGFTSKFQRFLDVRSGDYSNG